MKLKKCPFFIVFFLFLTHSGLLWTQSSYPYVNYVESVDKQNFNFIRGIFQDENGFIWMPTQEGLLRYDGYELKPFLRTQGDTSIVLSDKLKLLQAGKNGRLYVMAGLDGFSSFDIKTEKFKNWPYSLSDTIGFAIQRISRLVEEEDGTIWLASKGFHHWNLETDEIQSYYPSEMLSLSDDSARAADRVALLQKDPKNQNYLWFGTEFGLLRFDKTTEELIRFHPPKEVTTSVFMPRSLQFGDDGILYIGTWYDGLYSFDPLTQKWENHHLFGQKDDSWEHNNNIARIRKKSDTELWVLATFRGLFVFNTLTKKFRLISPHTSLAELPSSSPYSLHDPLQFLETEDGAIMMPDYWGIHIIHPQQQQFKKVVTGAATVRTIIPETGTGKLYLPAGDQLQVYDPVKKTIETHEIASKNPNEKRIIAGRFSADGKLWLLGRNSFYELQPTGGVKPKSIFSFDSLQVVPGMHDDSYAYSFLIDRQQNLWVPLKRKGLLKVHLPTNRSRLYQFSYDYFGKNFNYGFPGDIIETEPNHIWIAFGGGICFTNDAGQTWTEYPAVTPTDKNIAFHVTTQLQADFQGRLWIGSAKKGLFYLHHNLPQPQPIFALTTADGLPSMEVHDLELDQSGHLWLITDKGLSRMHTDSLTFETYGPEYGLEGLQELTLLPSGEMAIAATGGFYLFHPDSVQTDTTTYQPIIHGFKVNGQAFPLDRAVQYLSEIRLNYDQNFFTFDFSAPNYWAPHLVKYQFQLVGVDPDWVDAGDRRSANYTRISPGHYTFMVKASNVKGEWNEAATSLSLVVSPPWWATPWAYMLYTILALLLLTSFFLYQRRRWQLQSDLRLEQEKAKRLKEVDQLKSRFYTNITHEFRTPLTVIKGISNQIDSQEKIKTLILRNSNRLLNLVNQLLDLSKLETQSLPINWVQGDAIPYLKYLTESCHSLAGSKNINLAFFSKEDHLIMDFDENKLQQILINLLSNAIKFTPEYGSVKVIAAQIIEKGAPFLKLTVKDTGKGIPQEKLTNIFNRFYQIDDSTTRQGEGSGIGLALVKELVHLLAGRIEVESELGKGSSFVVYLPIHQEAQKELTIDPSARPAPLIDEAERVDYAIHNPIVANGENPIVLIIEDNADVTEYIISCLAADYNLQTALNGKIGMKKALEMIPDVILSDVMMPEMDGFEVCRHLKTDRRTSHIPIVLLTAKATQEDKVAGLSHGADAYLTKPFDKEELLIRLSNLAAQSRRLRERLAEPAGLVGQANAIEAREAAFLQELNAVIASNLDNELFDTNYLCRAIAMSRAQLHRKLKALTGQATANYIRTFRLRKAKTLLETTDTPIGEIASQVGFKDFSHFSRSFYKEFELRPSETRK